MTATAIDRFADIVGAEHVLTEDAELLEFRDPYQPLAWDDYTPAAVVQPATVEQVRDIVRVAAEHGVPLWTNSQARNNGYGGAGVRVKGAVTVNLRRMNRILEIDDELCYARVEPGVSFLQLYEALRDGGHPLMLSVPDIGWGSVIGNSLDHGVTYLPLGQDFMAPCGMEVVLADGDVLRTGMGGVPGGRAWNVYKRGLGPTLDQLFMQSNFGIVTKMGLWLAPLPEAIMPLSIVAPREEQLGDVIDTLRRLMLDGTLQGVPGCFNATAIACMVTRRSDWYDGDDAMPDDVVDRMARELGIGRWNIRAGLWGDGDAIDLAFVKVRRAFEAIPGVEVRGTKHTPDEVAALPSGNDQVMSGVANLDLVQMAAWDGGETGGHMGFSPVVPLVGREVVALHELLKPLVEGAGLDYSTDVMAIGARSAIMVVGNSFDFSDEEATRRVYENTKNLVREAGKHGYGEYRAHLDFMDLAAEQYSFNDHAYLRFVQRIKDAVDPAGILSPGKQGIWPMTLRAEDRR